MSARSVPSWGDLWSRAKLLLRAQAAAPIRETLRQRRMAWQEDAAHRREAARLVLQARTYAAADINRLTGDWFTSLLSADAELKGDIKRLRGAARSLERDNPQGARYPAMLAENVVGHRGIQLQMRLRTTRDVPATRENDAIEQAFRLWGEEAASADGRHTWGEIQQLVVRRLPVDGEFLLRHIRGADNAFGYAVELLDPDLLDAELGGSAPVRLPNGNEIRLGIEVEPRFGRRVAYYLWSAHPGDAATNRKRERVPAEDIEHLFVALRPGQSRGVTWFAPVLIASKMRGGYEEAAITAARIGASSMAAIAIDPEKAGGVGTPAPGQGAIPLEMEPGRFFRLNPGESLQAMPLEYPSTAFGPFIKHIDRSIANGLNVAYTSLTGDLEAVNYSSIRAGLLAERDFYRGLQQFVIAHLCRRVFREWVRMATATGWIQARDVQQVVMSADWKARGWQWVDPRNDVEAAARAVAEGFTTRSDVCAERGLDYEDVCVRLAEEQAFAASLGLKLGVLPVAAPTPSPNDDDPNQDANGEGSGTPPRDGGGDSAERHRLRLARGG